MFWFDYFFRVSFKSNFYLFTAYIPIIHWFGTDASYSMMAMQMLGPSIEDLFTSCNRRFSLKTVLMLADQMVL